jgi:hypothetical protein
MAECTILSFDLIEKMEEDDIPYLLFTLEFEKSFDGVGWSFLYKHCNICFEDFFRFWIKTFYMQLYYNKNVDSKLSAHDAFLEKS